MIEFTFSIFGYVFLGFWSRHDYVIMIIGRYNETILFKRIKIKP